MPGAEHMVDRNVSGEAVCTQEGREHLRTSAEALAQDARNNGRRGTIEVILNDDFVVPRQRPQHGGLDQGVSATVVTNLHRTMRNRLGDTTKSGVRNAESEQHSARAGCKQ